MAGLLAALAQMLGGCGQRQPPTPIVKADPPPKPPDCPDTSELENLKLSDGSLANVRIVSFLNTKLYFPEDWVKYYFFDKGVQFKGRPLKTVQGKFSPDIHSDECPGVVHEFNANHESPIMTVWILQGGKVPISHISAESKIRMLHFAANQQPQSQGLRAAGNGGFYDALVYPAPDIILFLTTKNDYGKRTVESHSIRYLVEWLSTPPSKRDNHRIFNLEVDQ